MWLSALYPSGSDRCGSEGDLDGKPKHLDHHNRGIFLHVEKDYLTVRYRGMGNDSQDVGVRIVICDK